MSNQLLEEYRQLLNQVRHRGRNHALIQSILISSSLIAVSLVLGLYFDAPINTKALVRVITFSTLIFGILLTLLSAIMDHTTYRLDEICFLRIHQIEDQIGLGSNRWVYEKIKSKWWFKLRKVVWPMICYGFLSFYVSIFIFLIFNDLTITIIIFVVLLALICFFGVLLHVQFEEELAEIEKNLP